MSQNVTLEMSYNTYLNLCDAVENAATHAGSFDEIQDLVHLVEFLEDEYHRDIAKQNMDFNTWKLHEELFKNKKIYHHEYFYNVEKIFKDYQEKELLNWNISESDKFHLICELIDVFK